MSGQRDWRGHSQPIVELGLGTLHPQGQYYPGPDTAEDRNHITCCLLTSQGEVTKERIKSHRAYTIHT